MWGQQQRRPRCCLLQGSFRHPLPALSSACYFPLSNLTSWYFTVSQVWHFKHLKEKKETAEAARKISIKALTVFAGQGQVLARGPPLLSGRRGPHPRSWSHLCLDGLLVTFLLPPSGAMLGQFSGQPQRWQR